MKQTVLTINEAAALKGMSRTAIYSAIARKKLPRRYFKGNLVVWEDDLLAWDAGKSKGGRPKGQSMSEQHKAQLREAQKRAWARRRQQRSGDDL
jgi:predicted DNA-binding transcriptional regulator AlpA